ncbi:LEM-3-like GIY-YIG domain-containing protein [Flavobacteriaceae bacterium 14752]|uniref:LEM-3-like GIY-YIG domain-containing protein n=1 Tax=Mesohalobacter salilacus TaxID=2491711 RepID=UPI000F6407A9|nr:hypothetical protein EIG84_12165 [Flavobacteriaceae bacterium 14752]
MSFTNHVITELRYYVYLYLHPETNEIFYVGKGNGNRAFSHLKEQSESKKVRYIEELKNQGLQPKIEILVHGLEDEKIALNVESSIIDLIGIKNLTNKQSGYKSATFGRMTIDQINSIYSKQPVDITEPSILIKVNQSFRFSMTENELYDYTRGRWNLNPDRAKNAKYGFAVYQGVIQEVYEIFKWHEAGTTESIRLENSKSPLDTKESLDGRYEFTGKIAPKDIREKYRLKSVEHIFSKKSQNPIKYVNI